MAVVLQRLIRGGKVFAAGSSNYSISAATIVARCFRFYPRGARQMSTMRIQNPNSSSPWLMIPPDSEGSYKFYSLAENKTLTLSGSEEIKELTTDLKFKCKGSSRGWLALLSPRNFDFFLYNPISRRHLKLPPLHTLPKDHYISRYVTKVILSCSPDDQEEDCCAVMMYDLDTLAFCCPGRSSEWTTFGWQACDDYDDDDDDEGGVFQMSYEDFVYSTSQKLFFGLSRYGYLETWDLSSSSSPRMIKKVKIKNKRSKAIYSFFGRKEHLVVAGRDLLMVTQYLMENVAQDGSGLRYFDKGLEKSPFVTIDFDIHKYDPEKGCFEYLVDSSSLDGLALFVGETNHSVAFPTHHFPELKPNSIYFTQPFYAGGLQGDYDKIDATPFDVGIFNSQNKTVSRCYYPCDTRSLQRIMPPPMWYFPSRSF